MAFQRKIDKRNVEEREVENTPVRRKPKHRLGGFQLKMTAPERDGWYRRFIIDRPGRLEEAERAGYAYVHDPKAKIGDNPEDVSKREGLDSRVSVRAGNHADGSPMMAYLMEMPLDWYKENQREKDEILKEREWQASQNTEGWNPQDKDHQYIPGKQR